MDEDILQEIPHDDLPILKNLYRKHEAEAPHVCNLINYCMIWKKKHPDDLYLYGVNNDWMKSGTFLLIMQYTCHDPFVYTLQKDCKTLRRALMETKRLDWTRGMRWYSISSKHLPTVREVIEKRNTSFHLYKDNNMFAIEREKALQYQIKCPQDVYIAKLNRSHAAIVDSIWPHRYEGSVDYTATLIEMSNSYGVFLKKDDALVCWILRGPMGHLCSLQTLDEHKRKGYGMLVTKVLSKEIAEEGFMPVGTVLMGNVASERMFTKLGFHCIDTCTYIQIY